MYANVDFPLRGTPQINMFFMACFLFTPQLVYFTIPNNCIRNIINTQPFKKGIPLFCVVSTSFVK